MSKLIILWLHCTTLLLDIRPSSSESVASRAGVFEAAAAYDVESTLFLNDNLSKDKEVGYKIRATLAVRPLWALAATAAPTTAEYLLQFQLLEPQLHLRGKHPNANFEPHKSIWDDHRDSTFYVHWKGGLVQDVYMDPIELPAVSNYKKSLISLFQFQTSDGEYNETDISGGCEVLYESLSADEFRKIKRRCAGDAVLEAGGARRVVRYSLAGGGVLQGAYCDERLELGPRGLGVRARSWVRLARRERPAPALAEAPLAASLEAALAALPPDVRAERPPLALRDDADRDDDDDETLEEVLAEVSAELEAEGEPGGGGGEAAALAAMRLAPAVRRAPPARLHAALAALAGAAPRTALVGVCRAVGLSGSGAAFGAAAAALQLSDGGGGEAALALLGGAALAPRADAALVSALTALALPPPADGALAAAALAAAVAAAASADAAAAAEPAGPAPLHGKRLRDRIAGAIAKCKDDDERCLVPLVRALGAAPRADCAELLLALSERAPPAAALAALASLRPLAAGGDRAVLHYARRLRLQAVALNPARPLEVRAAALEALVLASAGREQALAPAWAALGDGPLELRRLMRQLARAPPAPAPGWPAEWAAASGGSLALARAVGAWPAAGWAGELRSLQVAAGGVLRRGAVRLLAVHAATGASHELLAVELWTRGLEALGGGGDAEADPALSEPPVEGGPAAGLALAVTGVPLPPVSLFEGQAELLGHVWAGTGSTDTPVARAAWPLAERRGAVPLAAGVAARAALSAGAALALDARGAASLWARSAAAALRLRAAAVSRAHLAVRAPWGRLQAASQAAAAPRLAVRAHLDFYGAPALCVQVHTDDHDATHEVRLESRQGARGLRVSRRRRRALPAAGRTLALDARNDRACRHLAARDDDDD